jgi:hypothetical protein
MRIERNESVSHWYRQGCMSQTWCLITNNQVRQSTASATACTFSMLATVTEEE